MTAPLEDPDYVPQHPPVNGAIPDVIEKWGAESQLRWFARFSEQLAAKPHEVWNKYYVDTVAHRGLCCDSCMDDFGEGYDSPDGDRCCCLAPIVWNGRGC